ncbi:MAG: hypothetical protein IID08_00870 [Candidatus Hydrogenedentes bacterium]|nr:hypothetical protein [Candidatus Hydrogenedentota bacterium]
MYRTMILAGIALLGVTGMPVAADAGTYSPEVKLYVASNEGTDIYVVNMDTHKVEKIIDVGGAPHGLTVTRSGDWAYVSCSKINKLVAINTRTDEIEWTCDIGNNPHGLAVTPDGRFVYITIFGTGNTQSRTDVVDTKLRRRIKSIETGPGAHVAYAPNNAHAYATSWFANKVSVIDTETQEIVQTIPFPGMVRPIAVDRDERWLYAALSGFHGFMVADLEKGYPTKLVELPPFPADAKVPDHNTPVHGLEIRPGEKELWVTSVIDNKIYVYDLPRCELAAVIPTGTWPNWIVFSPGGERAYVTNALDDTVSAIDAETKKVIATTKVGTVPKRLAVVGALRR